MKRSLCGSVRFRAPGALPNQPRGWLARALGVLLILVLCTGRAAAQSPPAGPWIPAHLVFRENDPEELLWVPAMVVDSGGDVHLFWSYKTADSPHRGGNLIGYARFDGQKWSNPNFVLASPNGESTDSPRVAFDAAHGDIHVLWLGITTSYRTRIYHSYAHASAAWSAQGWSSPNAVPTQGDTRTTPPLWIDNRGVLHVVVETTQGAFYMRSTDRGNTWTEPVAIANLAGEEAISISDLAMDPRGRLHVVWAQYLTSNEMWREIYYSRSTDEGKNWSPAVNLSGQHYISQPSLAVVGKDEIHIVWNGSGSDSWRFHAYSTDGGSTWSEGKPILRVGGWAGRPALAVDGSGILHLVTAGNGFGLGGAVVHTYWDGQAWAEPELIPLEYYAEHAALVCRGGNLLIAAGDGSTPGGEGFDKVWTTTRILEAKAVPFHPLPTARPTPTLTPTATATAIPPTATSPPKPTFSSMPLGETGDTAPSPLLWAAGLAITVVLVVFLVQWLRRRS